VSATDIVLLLIFGFLLAIVLFLFLPAPGSRARGRVSADREVSGPIFRDDDRYWYGGVIYSNPDDPDPVVPKRYGFGWTINFGHPKGKVFLLIMVGLVLLPIVLAILVPGLNSSSGCHPTTGCHFP
jgi:uncharacterized membrane protein